MIGGYSQYKVVTTVLCTKCARKDDIICKRMSSDLLSMNFQATQRNNQRYC